MCRELCLAVLCAAVSSAFADVWVDCNTISATHDGTKDHPYLTIQEGVEACPVGETVWVEPGLYDASGAVESPDAHRSVVSITKAITVASTGGKFRTVIQGKKSSTDTTKSGLGADAVRCVYIGSGAKATVKGFTLADGYTNYAKVGTTDDVDANRGGGVLCSNGSNNGNNGANTAAFVVDCIVCGCRALRGGGLHGSSAVRCLVYNTAAGSSGPAERNANTYNCVFYNVSGSALFHGTHINATVVMAGEKDTATTGSPACYNCLFMGKGKIHSGVSTANPKFYNCVVNTTVDNESTDVSTSTRVTWSNSQVDADGAVYEAARLDFRSVSALQGAAAGGDVLYLSSIPEAYRDTDFAGNPLPTSGACYAGAVQGAFATAPTTATFPVKRVDPTTGVFFVDGRPVWFDGVVHFDTPYVTVTGRGVGEYRFVAAKYATSGSVFVPDMADNKVLFTPAAGATAKDDKLTAEFQRPIWADATADDDETADGTEAKPYKTLQAAYNKAVQGTDTLLVLAKPGDYKEGGVDSNNLFTRLGMNNGSKGVYVRSTDGAAVTFISGESDATSGQADAYGNGPNAVRCLAVPQAAGGSVQGFTLRYGRTNTVAGDGKANRGGAICLGFASMYLGLSNGGKNCPTVADCVITECDGVQGLVYYGYLKRCRITGNAFHGSGKTLVMQAWMEGCLIDNNETTLDKCSLCAGTAHAINCTFAKNSGFENLVGNNSVMLLNSISYRNGCNDLNSTASATNCLYATGVLGAGASGCLRGYPCFIGYGEDDFRLAEISPAFGLGVTDYLFSGVLDDKNPKDTWAFCDMTGVDGVSLFAADGSLTAGACGSRMPYEQKVVYVTPTGAGKKDGSSWEDACASIQAGVDAATDTTDFCGLRDRVTVAAGRYETGSRLSGKPGTDEPVLQARIVCEKEVEIVSDAGADETFIVGAADTTSGQADKNGNGPDAVRCVYMSAGLLKGFTLMDGHSALQTTATPTVNDEGGGYYGGARSRTASSRTAGRCARARHTAARGATVAFRAAARRRRRRTSAIRPCSSSAISAPTARALRRSRARRRSTAARLTAVTRTMPTC